MVNGVRSAWCRARGDHASLRPVRNGHRVVDGVLFDGTRRKNVNRVNTNVKLLHLPNDVLRYIMSMITHVRHDELREAGDAYASGVEVGSFRNALPLAYTCTKMLTIFYSSLDNLCLWSTSLSDNTLRSLCINASFDVKRLVLRGCEQLNDDGIHAVTAHLTQIRSVDLSFLPNITDSSVAALCTRRRKQLRKVLLRKCVQLTDVSVAALAHCRNLQVVDISYVPKVTDAGISLLAAGCGSNLRLLSISHNYRLTDISFRAIGLYCHNLTQLCARGLPLVSDRGFEALCENIGEQIEGIDVLDCVSLTRDPVLSCIRAYCPRVYANVYEDSDAKSLRQILVTTLRSNIFIVHGCDPVTGRDTIHMVLVDNGDILSANILSAGTTDLSLLGVVLCKSYGSALDDDTKAMLTRNYGILPSMLAE